MKKTTKTLLSLMLLASTVVVSGCSTKAAADPVSGPVTHVEVHGKSVPLFVGENSQIEVDTLPRTAQKVTLKYTSQDPKIASVDKDGKITAVAPGLTYITVSNLDGTASEDIRVTVCEDNLTKSQAEKIATSILAKQDEIGPEKAERFIIKNYIHSYTYKNNEIKDGYSGFEDMVISVKDAYFEVSGSEWTIKTPGGTPTLEDYAWIFYTNSSWQTYLFHRKGDIKNYFSIDTSAYASKGTGQRFNAVKAILDNIFTSGSDIAVDRIGYANMRDDLQDESPLRKDALIHEVQRAGSFGDGNIMYEYQAKDQHTTSTYNYEHNYDIPVGTPITVDYTVRGNGLNYFGADERVSQDFYYELDGDNYIQHYDATNAIFLIPEEEDIVLPDKTEYSLVENLFDL